MKRKNATRSALFTSIISLLLCVSMLVGTTFAWFTDEVKSGTNLIAAGNLDVEVYNDLKIDETKKVTTATKLFDEITYWEPGVVAYENLTVANLGSLALKYQLAVNFTDATTNAKGDTLAKVLKVGFVKGGIKGTTREAALTEVKAWQPLESFVQSGKLLPEDYKGEPVADAAEVSETFGLVIYWEPSNIDNEFNMNNGQTTTMKIDLGIKLFATQLQAEEDSYGPDYDEDAWAEGMQVFNADDLRAAFASGAEKIVLGADIVSEEGFMITKDAAINLNGHTVTATGDSVTLFQVGDGANEGKDCDADLTITGGKLVLESTNAKLNGTGTSTGASIAVDFMSTGTLKISDTEIIGSRRGGKRAVEIGTGEGYLKNVTIDCAYGSGVNAYWGSRVVLEDCNITVNGMYSAPYNSVCFSAMYGAEIIVNGGNYKLINNNTYSTGDTHGGWVGIIMSSGGTITTNGGIFENVPAEGFKPQYERAIFEAENNSPAVSTLNLLGGTFIPQEDQIYGGYGDKYYPTFNVPNLIEASEGVWVAAPVGADEVIMNAADLLALSGEKLKGTYALMADIDLGGAEISAMSAWYTNVTFLGNGHTISNAKIVSGENDNGTEQASLFFVSTNGSLTVSDLTVKDITVTTKNVDNGYAAAIIGYCEGAAVLDNVDVVNATVTGSKSSGLVIGHLTPAGSLTATDCDVTGSVTVSDYEANGHYAGKLIGTIAGNVALNSVTYKATIGGNLSAKNVGDIYGRQVSGSLTVDGAKVASDAASLKEGLAAGEDVVLATDVNTEAATTAPYGNKYAVKLDGGVLDGNGHELYMECYGDDYGIMTTGGTIKNITIQEGCRAVMIMYPTQDIIIDNANIGGDGVLYPINTGEAGAAGVKLIVTNSTLAGWTSYGLIESASFTNVKFEQGTYYNNIYGRVLKPYVNTTLTNCSFVAHMNLDLSALGQGQKITMVNCTVDGQPVNAATFTIPSTDAEYDTELFTVDLPSWASSINDCIVFG